MLICGEGVLLQRRRNGRMLFVRRRCFASLKLDPSLRCLPRKTGLAWPCLHPSVDILCTKYCVVDSR